MPNKLFVGGLLLALSLSAWGLMTASADCVELAGVVTCDSLPANDTNGFTSGTAGLTVEVLPGASVSNGGRAIDVNTDGHTITNDGSITSTNNDAIRVRDNSTVTNNGTITSTNGEGVDARNNATIINNGTITSTGQQGIQGNNNLSIINNGTITSPNDEGIQPDGANFTLINNGNIIAFDDGVDAAGATTNGATIINNGFISSQVNDGIELQDGILINHGTIISFGGAIDDQGIDLEGVAGDVLYILNTGTIQGAAVAIGTDAENGSETVENRGVIIGSIVLGAGNDAAIIHLNSTVTGLIDGGANGDILTLVLELSDEAELNRVAALLANLSPTGGTFNYTGQAITWANFEQLRTLLVKVILEGTAQTGPQQLCGTETRYKVFRLPDGVLEVYAGFDVTPNGFMIARITPTDLAAGQTRFQLSNPANLAVVVSTDSQGRRSLRVVNAAGNALGGACGF